MQEIAFFKLSNFYVYIIILKIFLLYMLVGGPITDKYRYRPIYRLSADISVLPINKMLIGIGYRYRLSVIGIGR